MQLTGIHHLTAVSADIQGNYRFYTNVLGMRLVKRTVNQDDVSAYHLFYSDAVGTPGHDLTFFDWPVQPEQRGINSVIRTFLRVNRDSLSYWKNRLAEHDVSHGEIMELDGRLTLEFEDHEGQRLAFVDDGGAGDLSTPWDKSPVPEEHQIRGLGPIVLSVPGLHPTQVVLENVLMMREVRQYDHPEFPDQPFHVFEMHGGGAHAEIHLVAQPNLPMARQGAGSVHHLALRTPTDEEYEGWHKRLNDVALPNSGKVNRFYFKSLYFREPNGILFEIATDEPGFDVDEPMETLGESLALPPFLEPRRAEIEANLKPIE